MSGDKSGMYGNAFAILRQFVRPRANKEQCELCSAELYSDHPHLVEPTSRKLLCSCEPCALLFSSKEGARYRRVPREIRYLPNFQLSDGLWDSLRIPINIAFFFHNSPAGKVIALYPGPAGATESLLDLESWHGIAEQNEILKNLEPDVQALLVYRIGQIHEHFIVPIDECYRLVGIIRTTWRGLSGGQEAWTEIRRFFNDLKKRSRSNQMEDSIA
jgi:hypothetical protein